MPPKSICELPLDQLRPAGEVGVEALDAPVVERQDVVLRRLDQEQALQLARASPAAPRRGRGPASSRPARRAPRRRRRAAAVRRHHPRGAVPRDRGPALVVDAAVARTSRSTASSRRSGGAGVVEGRRHARRRAAASAGCRGRTSAAGSPATSSTVAATSMTWWNWCRISPLALIPSGQWTIVPLRVPPQCEATCLVHWYGVSIACAQPTA